MPCMRVESSFIPNLNFFLLCSVDMMTQHWSLCCVGEILRSSPALCSALFCSDFNYWDCGDDNDHGSSSSLSPSVSCVAKPDGGDAVSPSSTSFLSLSTNGNADYNSGSGKKAGSLKIASKSSITYNCGDDNHCYSDSPAGNRTSNKQSTNALNLTIRAKHLKACVSTQFSRCAEIQHQVPFNVKGVMSVDGDSKMVTVGKVKDRQEQIRPRIISNLFKIPENILMNLDSLNHSAFLHDIKTLYIDIGERFQRVCS